MSEKAVPKRKAAPLATGRRRTSRKAFRLNAAGPFYVEDGCCFICCAPEHEAPGLMGFYQDPSGTHKGSHCYFRKQPKTRAELEQAIRAVWVSCCGALRYGGHDARV